MKSKEYITENGVLKSFSPLSELRKKNRLPYVCPECKEPFKSHHDPKMYQNFGMCLNCVTVADTNRIINGEMDQYTKNVINKNSLEWVKQLEEEVIDYIENDGLDQFITEAGDLESWTQYNDKEALKDKFKEEIEIFKQSLEDGIDESIGT